MLLCAFLTGTCQLHVRMRDDDYGFLYIKKQQKSTYSKLFELSVGKKEEYFPIVIVIESIT